MESLYSVIPCPFANKASLFPKQDFFAMHPSLVCAKTKPLWRTPTCYVCLFLHIHNPLAKG